MTTSTPIESKPTAEEQLATFVAESRAKAPSIFRTVMGHVTENHDLRKAEDANNRAHGYTAQYNTPGYVEWSKRNPDWKAVESLIQSRWDARLDEVEEASWRLLTALHALPYPKQQEIVKILTPEA